MADLIPTCPVAGWELSTLPLAHVLLTMQYFPDEAAMKAATPSVIRLVLTASQAAQLATRLPLMADQSLAREKRESGRA